MMCESEEKLAVEEVTSAAEMKTECDELASPPMVLEPDHPMMQRFQKAFKRHLERLMSKLTDEVLEMGNDLKMKEKERETTGVELYTLQQELYRQQMTLDKCEETIENLIKERENLDEIVKTKRSHWKEEVERLNSAKKKEHEMSSELQKLSSLEKQIEKWESEMDANLAVSQRISEKTQAEKNRLIEEKRKMDMHMLRLMAEVTKFEAEIKLMDAELDIKWEEKTVMHQTLSDANADLQALMEEQKRLCAAWNSVIAIMSQRDAVYSAASKELESCHKAFKTLNSEIESYKRSAADAMKKNEQLSVIYGRLLSEKESTDAALRASLGKKEEIERKIAFFASTIGEIEKDIEPLKIEVAQLEADLLARGEDCNNLNIERQSLEDKILVLLQGQMAFDKKSVHLNRIVRQLREKSRQLELVMVEKENKISKRFLEVEELKMVIANNNEIVSAMNKELESRERELKTAESEIAKCHLALMQKQSSYAVLLKKIEKQMEKQGTSKPGQDPGQLRVAELEKLNAEMQEKNEKMQSFWLLQQNNNVKLTNQRHQQMKEINLLRKQLAVLEQKTLKTELEIVKEQQITGEVNKSIAALQNKMMHLSNKLIGKKGYSNVLNKETALMQTNFLQTLKESELEQIRLKAEIRDLETSLEELAEKMLETQREMLTWERKIKMAIETKENMQKEKSGAGEIGQMKSEIHRMEIRYDQLKKAQEKLVSDLELCVLRRDSIVEVADAKEKRQSHVLNNKYIMQKKLDNLKNKIKSLQNERCNIEKAISRIQLTQDELREKTKTKEENLKVIEEKARKLDRELENGKLNKQQNLEMLVRRQKKCKMYSQVKLGKHRLLHKNELTIENEMQKERSINAALISVSEALIEDFPAHNFSLMRILNTVRAKPS